MLLIQKLLYIKLFLIALLISVSALCDLPRGVAQRIFFIEDEVNFASASGYLVRDQKKGNDYFFSVGHLANVPPQPFVALLGRDQFDQHADAGFMYFYNQEDKRLLYYNQDQGDVSVYSTHHISSEVLPGAPSNPADIDSNQAVRLTPAMAGKRDHNLIISGFKGMIFTNLSKIECQFEEIVEDYGNGVKLAMIDCPEILPQNGWESEGPGMSGGPVVEARNPYSVIGHIRGTFQGVPVKPGRQKIAIAVIDYNKIFEKL